mmetsp:Transcript_150/g.257  ORF Transcript_150/g.257 Transcript_150/m.257 type:complete len:115 (+) Transcript_150:83-427(+)
MEYCRYRIYTDAQLYASLDALVKSGSATVKQLRAHCTKPKRLISLLQVLLFAHVLYVAESSVDGNAPDEACDLLCAHEGLEEEQRHLPPSSPDIQRERKRSRPATAELEKEITV